MAGVEHPFGERAERPCPGISLIVQDGVRAVTAEQLWAETMGERRDSHQDGNGGKRMTQIFNLVFPAHREEMEIHGYRFTRIPEYQDRVRSLQHRVGGFSEFAIPVSTGTHAVTAIVETPEQPEEAVLPWGRQRTTKLDDILLLLSIFTSRHVFGTDELQPDDVVVADPRQYEHGRSLKLSLPHRFVELDGGCRSNLGFEEGVSAVYGRIQTPEWLKTYGRGAFLFMFREACKRQAIETSFLTCWSVWEHFFRLHHPELTSKELSGVSAARKIDFMLKRYGIYGQVEGFIPRGLRRLIGVRNQLVHDASLVDNRAGYDAWLFVQVSDRIVADALGLPPADVRDALGELRALLDVREPDVLRGGMD